MPRADHGGNAGHCTMLIAVDLGFSSYSNERHQPPTNGITKSIPGHISLHQANTSLQLPTLYWLTSSIVHASTKLQHSGTGSA